MWPRHERSVFVLAVVLGMAPARGVRVVLDNAVNETLQGSIPLFDFSLRGVLCADINFGPLQGVLTNFPQAVDTMRKKASALANEKNCRLCDISAGHAAMKSPTVTCAASRNSSGTGSTNVACLAGNGKTGWRKGKACLPCPDQCDSCAEPAKSDLTYFSHKWFKCVFAQESNNEPLPWRWGCEGVKNRSKHRGQKSFCKYRKDLAGTSTNRKDLEDGSAYWGLEIAAVRCSDFAEIDNLEGPVQGIAQAIAPALQDQYGKNCELCRVTAGGPISSKGVGQFKFATQDTTSWAHAKCAYDKLGIAACRSDNGPVGWAKKRDCAPCPLECATCKRVSSDSFSCKLRPMAKVDYQLGRLLSSSERHEDDSPPKLPDGFDCEKPEKRTCTRGSGFCMGYKVKCKFQVHVD